ncbi:HAD family phosphatase [Methylomonas sp. AM2-LC]|uniref:HAD family hydrolase n=1 Tax=Methylomonas sp. AM2-LC TaxID=3153301 RepID=UPI0032675837
MALCINNTLYKAVIFDFNGVLLLDSAWHEEAWSATIQKLSSRIWTSEEISHFMHGRTNRDIFCALLERQVDDQELAALSELKESKYRSICIEKGAEFSLPPRVPELLSSLKHAGIPIAIATASGEINVRFFYEALSLDRWFDWNHIVYDDGTFSGKPEPDIYIKAASRLGITPNRVIVVEDSVAGLKSARNAGIGHIVATGTTLLPSVANSQLFDTRLENMGDFLHYVKVL